MGRYTQRIHRRTVVCYGLTAILFTALFVRLGQLSSSGGYLEAAGNQSQYTLTIEKSRGFIYDCGLVPLVNREAKTVYAISPSERNLVAVLESVKVSRRKATAQLMESGKPFLLLSDYALSAEGVVPLSVYERYSENQLLPHIIGYLSGGKGVSGVEYAREEALSAHGTSYRLTYRVNGLGQVISGVQPEMISPREEDYGVVLTIDSRLQQIVQEVGSRYLKKGAVVIMDPYTGDLKAVASFPAYSLDTLTEDLADEENTPMINRAFYPYSVGSTFKVVTAAAALEQGYSISESYECLGSIDIGGQIFRCHQRSGHGELDMLDAMVESCNPYYIHLGSEVGREAMLSMAKSMGFGEGIVFGEGLKAMAGTLPSLSDLKNPAELANFSFGQGLLTATPIQLAVMMSAVCNGGNRVSPRLFLGEYQDGSLSRYPLSSQQRVISAYTAAQLQTYLIYAVMVKEGQNSLPQTVTAGGKTATAQTGKYDSQGNEYEHGWFAGFFPAAQPEYVVVVLAENGGGGNSSASPVFAAIADEIMALK